jgi:hypothetical protein
MAAKDTERIIYSPNKGEKQKNGVGFWTILGNRGARDVITGSRAVAMLAR